MRPLTLPERNVEKPSVSLSSLLSGARAAISGTTTVGLEQYVNEILASGFPGIRQTTGRAHRRMIDGYLQLVVDRDFPDAADRQVRNPAALRRWMAAYAAATSTTASYDTIRQAASHRQEVPAKRTTQAYRDTLERIWILDPVPAWVPTSGHLSRLNEHAKHQLCDPAFAAALVGANAATLLTGGPGEIVIPRGGTFLGALFESLAALELRVFAQHAEATVSHLRTKAGEHEIDFIVERADGSVVAVEVKLSATVDDTDVAHLHWLSNLLGKRVIDSVVLTTGADAYRRADGVAVVPLSLLGP
jgi:predicted AAA+ superfamily ATPase